MRKASKRKARAVVYLPTYSPNFNPDELWRADLKKRLRTLAARAVDELPRTVQRLCADTSSARLAAWFRHCFSFLQLN